MEIRDFTPAQTLMITSPLGVTGKDLLKYSFLDLIYKGVLKVYKAWRSPHPRDSRQRLYTLVSRGINFNNYSHSYHQDPFVRPFMENNYEYQVRILVRKIYKESGQGSGFKSKRVYKQLRKEGYFTTSFGLKYLNFFFRNSRGSRLKDKFNETLNLADDTLPSLVNNNKEATKKLLLTLGSNVLLLDCFNNQLVQQLSPLFREIDRNYINSSEKSSLDQMEMFEALFFTFLDTLDYFDTSFDALDSSFDFGTSDFGGDSSVTDFGVGDL